MATAELIQQAKAGDADGTHLMEILHAQVNAARPRRLGQAVIGVIIMMRKKALPLLN